MFSPKNLNKAIERIGVADRPIDDLVVKIVKRLVKKQKKHRGSILNITPVWDDNYTTISRVGVTFEADDQSIVSVAALSDGAMDVLRTINFLREQFENDYSHCQVETFYGYKVTVDRCANTAEVTLPVFVSSCARDVIVTLKVRW